MMHQKIFDEAVEHHEANRLEPAEQLYRQILSTDPQHVDALRMLGVLMGQRGRPQEAAGAYGRAAALSPNSAIAHYDCGAALSAVKRYAEAEVEFRRAIELRADFGEAYNGLGSVLLAGGRLEEAETAYRKSCHLLPAAPEPVNNLGNVLRGRGNLDDAIRLLRRAIELESAFPAAHNNLGQALQAKGDVESAIASYQAAVSIDPEFADAWFRLGNALLSQRRINEAIPALEQAVRKRPGNALTHHVLGDALREAGRRTDAVAAYRQAVALQNDLAESHNNLGNLLQELGQVEEAVKAYRAGLKTKPELPWVHFNLGNALHSLGQYDEAMDAYRQALAIQPDYAEALNNLGNSMRARGFCSAAAGAYRKASALKPDFADAHSNLGMALQNEGALHEAAAAFQRALELNPNLPEAHINLGNLLKDSGRLEEALASYRRAQELKPDAATAGNFLYGLHFHPDYGPREIYEEHRKWNERFIRPLMATHRPHDNDRTPGRRLRIGYVSPDFREHPVGRFMWPLLKHHDHSKFEIYCYSDVRMESFLTNELKRYTDVWRRTVGMPDERMAELVREDKIDILVDLAMHLDGSRMMVFGRKPAPVQVTYLAYCGTTGSEAIDYRLTDPYLDPNDDEQQYYVEKPMRLRSYWCYIPATDAPDVVPTPALSKGYVTFGCLNNFSKVSGPTIQTWCALLKRVPGSRLIVHSHTGTHREQIKERFAALGIEGDRIEFVGFVPMTEYLGTYGRIDVALDPFPYPGGTTSCDAAWMGVPVVTLAGRTPVSRGGASVLSNLGMTELISRDADQYVQIAAGLASDLPRLQSIRASLRQRMRGSALTDSTGFARDMESAFVRMWETWRQSPATSTGSRATPLLPTAEELNARGIALERQGDFAAAEAAYRQAIELRPDWPEVRFHLANAVFGQGKLEQSIEAYREVIALSPEYPEPFNNMGIALSELGRSDEAIAAFTRAVELNPNFPDALASLGTALRNAGRLDEASDLAFRALAINPNSPIALMNLGNINASRGKVDEAIEYYRKARPFDTTLTANHNLLFSVNFSPNYSDQHIAAEHAQWEREYVLPRVQALTSHPNNRDPDRKLRIGYVSPDFRHAVGRFLLPLFSNHDRTQFELYCYASIALADEITEMFRSAAHAWRDGLPLNDAQLAKTIYDDGIDILVDLSMHTGGSRLIVFAHKPAPVQISYLAYAGTTGLRAIDYRLTDPYLDPPGKDESVFVEKPIRIGTFWCYQAPDNVPAIGPVPALANGVVTFGCLNNFSKVNAGVLELWRKILQAVPRSRLILHAYEGIHRQQTRDYFAAGGVSPDRIEFSAVIPAEQYLQQYNRIDIALDPFPFGGGTTTCDALYMGVPLITMPGRTHVSRAGVSILSNAGLAEWIARDSNDYLNRAVALANDLQKLEAFRASVRGRMQSSPLMNAAKFTRDVEAAYRHCWRRWCSAQGS